MDANEHDPYRDAGVDIDAGDALVRRIAPLAKATARAGSLGGLGGFGAVFDPKAAGYADPLLVSATDGVGTKIKIAIETGRHGTIGIDLVAMIVNDLVVQGAEPLFFLDYFATSGLDVGVAAQVIEGIAAGCRTAGCALVGGETAEMPGLYAKGDYDLAGFAVGAVERHRLLPRPDIAAGDALIGLPSSGVHSNGYSLVRKRVTEAGLDYAAPCPFAPNMSLGEALLEPTRIYVAACLDLAKAGLAKGMAHITGGGLTENIPRMLPDGLGAALDAATWNRPPVFAWLAAQGRIGPAAMARTFNCGIGMVIAVTADRTDEALERLGAAGEAPVVIGRVVPTTGPRVTIANEALLCRA